MSKKVFVLLIALIFFSTIIYIVVKDNKIAKEKQYINAQELQNETETYDENIEIPEEEEGAILQIPAIYLEAPVKEGTSDEVLENYVGHIEETAEFDGNVGLAAHNRGANVNYFENLNQLKVGDEIIYKYNEKIRKYKIENISEILDTDWAKFENSEENKLTLITCINNKINLRLCVEAKEI